MLYNPPYTAYALVKYQLGGLTAELNVLLKFCYRVNVEDVCSWGYPLEISREVINAIWCLKEGLSRATRNIDQPLNW